MIIAIDYDNTFTNDPDYWRFFIKQGEARGHTFVCITMRSTPPKYNMSADLPKLPASVELILAKGRAKRTVAKEHNISVDVWIDDRPVDIIEGFQTHRSAR